MFASSLISKACSQIVVPTTQTVTTTGATTTTTIDVTVTVSPTTTATITSTDIIVTTIGTTVDQAVFQQIDAGDDCPGFGGSVTPITAVSAADINGCLQACFGAF
jgi:hypothetical protein